MTKKYGFILTGENKKDTFPNHVPFVPEGERYRYFQIKESIHTLRMIDKGLIGKIYYLFGNSGLSRPEIELNWSGYALKATSLVNNP